jgi:lipopolysaccharide export system protein LptA
LLACSSSGWALPGDREKPIDIESDRNRGNLATHEIIYMGSVRIEQGALIIEADEVTVLRTPEGTIRRMEGLGLTEVARASDQLAENDPYTHLFGDLVVYDAESGFISALGQARLQQGPNLVTAHFIRFELETEEFFADQEGPDGSLGARVQMCLIPDSDDTTEESDFDAEATQRPTSCETIR